MRRAHAPRQPSPAGQAPLPPNTKTPPADAATPCAPLGRGGAPYAGSERSVQRTPPGSKAWRSFRRAADGGRGTKLRIGNSLKRFCSELPSVPRALIKALL
jgi:hypothetical protein